MRATESVFAVTLTEVNCGECGGTYAINERYRRQREEKGGGWHCPYCQCSWGFFQNNENARLRKMLEEANQKNTELAGNYKRLFDDRNKIGAELHRHKTRTKAGVCPCCKRTFSQLQRHMKTKHPDYPAK